MIGEKEMNKNENEEEIEKLKKLKKQWEEEPIIPFMVHLQRIAVEEVLEYCLERINHHKNIEEFKEEIKELTEAIHKRNMEAMDFNLRKLLF